MKQMVSPKGVHVDASTSLLLCGTGAAVDTGQNHCTVTAAKDAVGVEALVSGASMAAPDTIGPRKEPKASQSKDGIKVKVNQ